MKKSLFVFLSTLFAIQPAFATYAGRTEVGADIGGLFFEGDTDVNEDWYIGGRIGHYMTENVMVEGTIGTVDTEITGTNRELDILIPTVQLQYHIGRGLLRPYLSAGIGYLSFNPQRFIRREPTDFLFLYGLGLKWLVTPNVALRVEGRHGIDTESGKGTHLGLGLAGISWLFGGEPAPVARKIEVADEDKDGVVDGFDACPGTPAGVQVDPNGCPLDSDGDGVSDDKDQCPNTPAGMFVNPNGCPPPDSDGDGVYDDMDQCPETPVGVRVDTKGCPRDSDNDGVVDGKDQCPDTPAGMPVDVNGCPKEAAIPVTDNWVLSGVQFETASARLKAQSRTALDKAVKILKANPSVRVEVQGHTDNVGGLKYNMDLSARRAASVKAYLVGKGIDPARLETKGYGPTDPISSNKTVQGRAKNRRIEFQVLSR